METIVIDQDIHLLCVRASAFPDGVMEAHNKVHAFVPAAGGRSYYGISRPEQGTIVYKAGVELKDGEGADLPGTEIITLPKGRYISMTINDFMSDIQSIGTTFQHLLQQPDLDPKGYCVERYLNEKDVQCMVRLRDQAGRG